MALVLNERVKETTTTTGTGALSLGGAPTGFETFAAGIGNSNTTYYAIFHATADEFEVGLGTLDSDSSDLTRTTVYASSNSDSAVNFSSGTKTVFCTMPAARSVFLDADGDVTLGANLDVGGNLTVTGTTTFNGGTLTLGDANTDNIVFGGEVDSNIIPDDDNTYDLGSSSKEWKDLYIDGVAYVDAINFNGTAISATAAELNIMDGVTSTAAELNILDGVTSTAAELNILDGVTSTAAELNILDGVTSTAAELNVLDGITAVVGELNALDLGSTAVGTAIASKAVILDSNKDYTGFRNITLSGELDAGSLDVSGDADIDGTLETDALSINGTAVSSTAAELNTLDGITAVVGELNALDLGSTAVGTAIASKAVILDANKDYTGIRNLTITGELDGATLDISGDADIDGTLEADAITVNGTALASVIAGTTVTLASTVTVTDSTANTNFPVVFHDESNALLDDTGALRYNPSTGELLVPKLTVAGTTTTVDTVTMNAENAIVFEGATADAHETTLTIIDPTGDRTINLPNVSGTIPVLAAVSTTQITSTPEELNILDGVTSTAAELNILDGVTSTAAELNILDGVTSTAAELNVLDGITAVVGELNALDLGSTAVGTAIASKAVILDANKDYTGIRNLTITGELDGATLDISGDADIDGTLEADAITINGTSTDSLYAGAGFAVAMAIAL
jgi:cytoskeletal protein CcmA (bactofilin family)